ncbi:hypothetical protein GHT06_016478 [Daphnia sinensis]|uniref:Uncharacterized protein n=1 Tax=Daphnia sinensis TaxID=1820382 RepID=A0AAD5L6M2_9CRUS|nr:hypothetical protein GHT06_016478 [Daphnia sinensis]
MEYLCLLFSRLSLQLACCKRKRTEECPFEAVRLKSRVKRRCLTRPTVRLARVHPETCDKDREVSAPVPESRPAEPSRKRPASENDECSGPGSSKRVCRTVIPPTRVPPNTVSGEVGRRTVHLKKINKQPLPVPKIEVTIKPERPAQLPVEIPVGATCTKVRTIKVRRLDEQPEPVKRTSVFDRLGGVECKPVLVDRAKPSVFQRLGERPPQGYDREQPGRWTHGKKPYHQEFRSPSANGTMSNGRWYRSDGRAFRRI